MSQVKINGARVKFDKITEWGGFQIQMQALFIIINVKPFFALFASYFYFMSE